MRLSGFSKAFLLAYMMIKPGWLEKGGLVPRIVVLILGFYDRYQV